MSWVMRKESGDEHHMSSIDKSKPGGVQLSIANEEDIKKLLLCDMKH